MVAFKRELITAPYWIGRKSVTRYRYLRYQMEKAFLYVTASFPVLFPGRGNDGHVSLRMRFDRTAL